MWDVTKKEFLVILHFYLIGSILQLSKASAPSASLPPTPSPSPCITHLWSRRGEFPPGKSLIVGMHPNCHCILCNLTSEARIPKKSATFSLEMSTFCTDEHCTAWSLLVPQHLKDICSNMLWIDVIKNTGSSAQFPLTVMLVHYFIHPPKSISSSCHLIRTMFICLSFTLAKFPVRRSVARRNIAARGGCNSSRGRCAASQALPRSSIKECAASLTRLL